MSAEPSRFSLVTLLGALGGLLIVLSSFLPMLSQTAPAGAEVPWLEDYRRQLRELRQSLSGPEAPPEARQLLAVTEPSLQRVDDFLAQPSGYRLWLVLRDAHRFCGMALGLSGLLQLKPEEIELLRIARDALVGVLLFLGVIPLIGGYHVVRGVLLRFRKHVTLALFFTFFAGLAYVLIPTVVLLGLPQRGFLGSAPYSLLAGGALLLFCSLFGVSRENWWRAYLLDLAGLGAIAYFTVQLSQALG
jgi:hypothetical protein